MKGTTYAGIVHLPRHPEADIHGLMRAVMRTDSLFRLEQACQLWDIPFRMSLFGMHVWGESKSIAEIHAGELHYGVLLVCRLDQAYLSSEAYQPIPKNLLVRRRA